jgi:hypothetical protein
MDSVFKALWATFIILPIFAHAERPKAPSAKAFAVFGISYNEDNNMALGGVMGTAFFVSPTKAVTAFHVLQLNSFQPNPGFKHKKVYLIHENEPPIEIKRDQATFLASRDQTIIQIKEKERVPNRFIYEIATSVLPNTNVVTEGFEANSAGPVIVRDGRHLRIEKVPTLKRRELRGLVLSQANIQLKAADVHLNGVNCVQLSYAPVVGFSGGPVIAQGRVLAMNSFAEPATRARTWAVNMAQK